MGVCVVVAPVAGRLVGLADVPDEVFASGTLGEGFGIWPRAEKVVAPLAGTVSALTPTRHAIGITTPEGVEVMVHVGVDTVRMRGAGFSYLVRQGQPVRTGEALLCFDQALIAQRGLDDIVVTVLCEVPEGAVATRLVDNGEVDAGDGILEVSY